MDCIPSMFPRITLIVDQPSIPPCRIGTEHEKLGYATVSRRRLSHDQIEQLLRGLQARLGWAPIEEGGRWIGLEGEGQSITLEPGGQFELSGAPLADCHQMREEVDAHLTAVRRRPCSAHSGTHWVLPTLSSACMPSQALRRAAQPTHCWPCA